MKELSHWWKLPVPLVWRDSGEDSVCDVTHPRFGVIGIVINRMDNRARISIYREHYPQQTWYVSWRGVYKLKAIQARARERAQQYLYSLR